MTTLKWKTGTVFNMYKFWYAGHNEGTKRVTFNIDKTTEDYPYRVSMYGNYQGDFKTLASAKKFANELLEETIRSIDS